MITEVESKGILNKASKPSSWFGVEYNFNIYRGCEHKCIYCDSRSKCYHIDNFDSEVIVKTNAPELMRKQMSRMRKRYTVGTGGMSDPYMPIEKKYKLTRECLEVIDDFRMRVHIATKSNLILRDIDILERISKRYACVAMTVTTMDEELASFIEPGAPSSQDRMEVVGILNEIGVNAGVLLMPQLPFLMETQEHLDKLIDAFIKYKVKFVYPAFGMTLREGNREYYYDRLDELDQTLRIKYGKRYGNRYGASCINSKKMYRYFNQRCKEEGIKVGMHSYAQELGSAQINLFSKQDTE